MTMKRLTSILLCIAMVFCLAACGPEKSEPKPAESQTPDTPSTGEVVYKDKIVIANNDVLKKLDPQSNNTLVNMHIYALTHNTLVDYDEANGKVIGDLAKEFTMIDDCTYEFILHENVKFHNGDPCTTEDVKYTLERAAESASQSSRVQDIKEIQIVDDTTMRIILNNPNMAFLANMTEPVMGILCKNAIEADPDNGPICGTGPYTMTEWVPNDYVLLTRNDDFWGELPKTRQIEYRMIAEGSSRVIALQTGDADIILNVPANEVSYIADDPNCNMLQMTSTNLQYLALNPNREILSDLRVRQAINYAINQEDVIVAIMEGMANYYPTVVAPSTSGFNADIKGYEFDPEKAKELLTEAGYPDGFTLHAVLDGTKWEAIFEIIQAQLAEVGIEAVMDSSDTAVWTERFKAGDYDMVFAQMAFGASIDAGLRPLWYSDSFSNKMSLRDPELDAMLDKATTIIDENERNAYYGEIQEYMVNLASMIPMYIQDLLIGTNNALEGMTFRADQRHDFSGIYIVEG